MNRGKLRIEYFMPQLLERMIKDKPNFIHMEESGAGGPYHVLSYKLRFRRKEVGWDFHNNVKNFIDNVYTYVVDHYSQWQCPSREFQVMWKGKTHALSGEIYYVVEVAVVWNYNAYTDAVNDMERFMIGANKLLAMNAKRPCVIVGDAKHDTEVVRSEKWGDGPIHDPGFYNLVAH